MSCAAVLLVRLPPRYPCFTRGYAGGYNCGTTEKPGDIPVRPDDGSGRMFVTGDPGGPTTCRLRA